MTIVPINPQRVIHDCRTVASSAVKSMGDVQWWPCGFAWLVIRPARGPFVKYLKDNNIGHSNYGGGWAISSNDLVPEYCGQNMDVKAAACRAALSALALHGISATLETRMD